MKKFGLMSLIVASALFIALAPISLSADDGKCGGGKCGGMKKNKPMKCGIGKCGKAEKKSDAKKCGDEKKEKKAMKCGAGKCG